MKKQIIITEEEKKDIINLYSEKNILLEKIRVTDIQNKLVQLGHESILSGGGKLKNPVDGKFGKFTLAAITKAIDNKLASKTETPAQTGTTQTNTSQTGTTQSQQMQS